MIAGLSHWTLLRVGLGGLAVPVGTCLAAALWTGGTRTRGGTTAGLLAAALASRLLPLGLARDAIYATVIFAWPTLAALRRVSPDVIAEATMAGAGPVRRSLLVLRLAAPGLAAGAVLWLAAPDLGLPATLLIAGLALVWGAGSEARPRGVAPWTPIGVRGPQTPLG